RKRAYYLKTQPATGILNRNMIYSTKLEEVEEMLNKISEIEGLIIEVIGNWIWISGKTMENREFLKAAGCKYAPKKKVWFYRPEEHKCLNNRREHSLDEIRENYGSHSFSGGKKMKVLAN
ncbi:hypothetical protein ACUUMB_23415, partial [Enterobacter kobei]